MQLEDISSCLISCCLGIQPEPYLAKFSFQAVIESENVSPEPFFLQPKLSQLPEPLLKELVPKTLPQFPCPSLENLHHLNVCQVPKTEHRIWCAASPMPSAGEWSLHLNTDRLEASTSSLCSLLQYLTTLSVRKYFLMSSVNLPWYSIKPLYILSLDPEEERSAPPSPLPSSGNCRKQWSHSSASFSTSWTSPESLAAPFWICLPTLLAALLVSSGCIQGTPHPSWRAQNCTCRWDHTKDEYRRIVTSSDSWWFFLNSHSSLSEVKQGQAWGSPVTHLVWSLNWTLLIYLYMSQEPVYVYVVLELISLCAALKVWPYEAPGLLSQHQLYR